jgi:hypothetical protein
MLFLVSGIMYVVPGVRDHVCCSWCQGSCMLFLVSGIMYVVPGVRDHEGAEDLYLYLLFLRR